MDNFAKKVLDRATDYRGSRSRKVAKGIGGGVILLLLGALGLEVANTDFDLGALFSGASPSDAKIERDSNGNLKRDASGNFSTRVLRDKDGAVATGGTAGAKYTDEYNCADFATQGEAQRFFTNAGGLTRDTNGLDGDNDGVACENLPK